MEEYFIEIKDVDTDEVLNTYTVYANSKAEARKEANAKIKLVITELQ